MEQEELTETIKKKQKVDRGCVGVGVCVCVSTRALQCSQSYTISHNDTQLEHTECLLACISQAFI